MSDYKVYKVWVPEVEFELLILCIPNEEVDDKLAYFARDKGLIKKSFYEDFLIITCVANINQLMAHMNQNMDKDKDASSIRETVISEILRVNPILQPENLIINRNLVVKIKSDESVDDRPLTSNRSWIIVDEVAEDSPDEEESDAETSKEQREELAQDVDYTVVRRWWKRLRRYIDIKKFNENDISALIGKVFFYNKSTFYTYINSVCVVDLEDLFESLDTEGILNRVSPPIILGEIYELCKDVNPFLTFENAKNITGNEVTDKHDEDACDSKCSKASNSTKKEQSKKKKKKTFRDVKKEDLLSLSMSMKKAIVGQDAAIDQLTDAIKRASVGLKDPERPIGSFIFAGSTGCGKSLTSKVLAEKLTKDKNNLTIIDCSEYMADHEYSKLIGCFVPGTKVLMGDGSRKSIEEVSIGDKVITHLGRPKEVEFVHEYLQEGEMLGIKTVNSNIMEVTTKTHELLVVKAAVCSRKHRGHIVCKPSCSSTDCSKKLFHSYRQEWLPAKDISVGDILAYPRYKPTGLYPTEIDLSDYIDESSMYKYDDDFVWAQGHVKVPRHIKVNEDLARIGGYYVSEGGSSNTLKTINFTFNSKEHDYVIEVVKLLRRVFGKDIRIKIVDRTPDNSYRIYVSSKIVCKFMVDLFGKDTYVKKAPSWLKDVPDNILRGFLETAVFGDGCQVIPRRMDYSTVSATLHSQMELYFRRLGYITSTHIETMRGTGTTGISNKDRYRLYISGSQIERLNAEFNFGIDLSDMELTNIQRMSWIDADYVYKQVKELHTVNYVGKVYDLAVKDDTSYVIDFAVHNSPQGYVGYEQGGILTNAIIENPFNIIVFDEIEKASHKVYDLMLQILDEGRLTDNKGNKVSFKDTIIIMTSNIGVSEVKSIGKVIGFGDVAKLTDVKKAKAIDGAIKDKFRPEFINRIDSIVYFNTLTRNDYLKIIDLELNKLNDNLMSSDTEYKDIKLSFDGKTRSYILKNGTDESLGARPLKRYIEKNISTPLANKLLNDNIDPNATIHVTTKKGKVTFTVNEHSPLYNDVVECSLLMGEVS